MFFHGTSTAVLSDGSFLLLPPSVTGVISEEGRKINTDKVFFTKDIGSARIYAGRACGKFGGNPIIFRVIPMSEIISLNQSPGTSVFMADWAFIEESL